MTGGGQDENSEFWITESGLCVYGGAYGGRRRNPCLRGAAGVLRREGTESPWQRRGLEYIMRD